MEHDSAECSCAMIGQGKASPARLHKSGKHKPDRRHPAGQCTFHMESEEKTMEHENQFLGTGRIVKVYGEREESPKQRIKDKDKRRAAYHRFYTDMKWGYAKNYQVSLDSGKLGLERCAEILRLLY